MRCAGWFVLICCPVTLQIGLSACVNQIRPYDNGRTSILKRFAQVPKEIAWKREYWCPQGMTYIDPGLCSNSNEAQGPFSPAMNAICLKNATSTVCSADRWPKSIAQNARGNSWCPPGTQPLPDSGLCETGGNVYGPFSLRLVEACQNGASDKSECTLNRWKTESALAFYQKISGRDQSRYLPKPNDSSHGNDTSPDPKPDTNSGTTPNNTVCYSSRSSRLSKGFFNPMPGGLIDGYASDSGLDIHGDFQDIFAVADGIIEYSEWGHTSWMKAPDTPYSVRIRLVSPVAWTGGKKITHIYYTHLSKLQYKSPPDGTRVRGGDCLGISGLGNRVPHLHIGFLLNNQVEQDNSHYYLNYTEITDLLGSEYHQGSTLPEK